MLWKCLFVYFVEWRRGYERWPRLGARDIWVVEARWSPVSLSVPSQHPLSLMCEGRENGREKEGKIAGDEKKKHGLAMNRKKSGGEKVVSR